MLKNRYLAAFAFVGLMGVAACADNEPEVVEEPVLEEPVVDPVTEPATPTMTDTMGMGMDTLGADTMTLQDDTVGM